MRCNEILSLYTSTAMFNVSHKPDTTASFTNKNKYWVHSLNTWFLALGSHSVPRNPLHQHTFPQNPTNHPVKDSKVHPGTGNEGPEGEERHSSTLSLTSSTPRPQVPIVTEDGWTPGTVWTDAENLTATGIRSPFRPSRSESLHRLRYPGPLL